MQSKDYHGTHLQASLSRMMMVDGGWWQCRREGGDGSNGPWLVCFCACGETTKNKVKPRKGECLMELTTWPRG